MADKVHILSQAVDDDKTKIAIRQLERLVQSAIVSISDLKITKAAVSTVVTGGNYGDVTVSGTGTTWTINSNVVSLAKLVQAATATFLGRTTAGTGDVEALTATQATALLNLATTSAKGLAPVLPNNATKYLDGTGVYSTPVGMAIGGAVTSATPGSVLFAATGPVLAQNNANLNWNNTSNTLNLTGGGASSYALDIHGFDTSGTSNTARIANNAGGSGLASLQFDNQSTYTGALIGSNFANFGLANGLSLVVPTGKTVGFRQGASVSTAQIAQFDGTNSYIYSNLSVGHQNNPATALDVRVSGSGGVASVQNTSATGFSDILFYDQTRTLQGAVGYANASETAVSAAAGLNILYSQSTTDWALINGVANKAEIRFGMTDGSTFAQMQNGSGAAVSAASTGRLIYNSTRQKFQVSLNGAAYVDVATPPTVERLSASGAASPTVDRAFVSGTGTALTLANGSTDGFIKTFVITGGTGTITPANMQNGTVLTYSAVPANVSLIWDATLSKWHVNGSPYNMATT